MISFLQSSIFFTFPFVFHFALLFDFFFVIFFLFSEKHSPFSYRNVSENKKNEKIEIITKLY